VLVAALTPLIVVAVRRPPIEGLIALEVAGVIASVILLLVSEGTNRQPFADLALVLAVTSLAGALAFVRYFERVG
jgi:multisubunit Na+/H+ antiporter MnhF subunit